MVIEVEVDLMEAVRKGWVQNGGAGALSGLAPGPNQRSHFVKPLLRDDTNFLIWRWLDLFNGLQLG